MTCVCAMPSQSSSKSPYEVLAGFDWYDGWRECIVRCTQCGNAYYVRTLWTDDSNDDLGDVRVFTLAELQLDVVAELMDDVEKATVNGIVQWSALNTRWSEVLESASQALVVAARHIDGEILGVKAYPQRGLPTFDDLGISRSGPIR